MEQNRKRQTFDQAYTEHQQKKWDQAIDSARNTIIKNAQKSRADKEQARKDWDELDSYEDYMEKFSQRDDDKEYSMPDRNNPKIDEEHLVHFINMNKTFKDLRRKMDKINSLKKIDTTGMHYQEVKAHYRFIAEIERQFSEQSSQILGASTGDNYRYASQAIDYLWSLGHSDSATPDADPAKASADADPASGSAADNSANTNPADKDSVDDSADIDPSAPVDNKEKFKDGKSRLKKIGAFLRRHFGKIAAVGALGFSIGAWANSNNSNSDGGVNNNGYRAALEHALATGTNEVFKRLFNEQVVNAEDLPTENQSSVEAIGYAGYHGSRSVGDRGVNRDAQPEVEPTQETKVSKENYNSLDQLFKYVNQTPGYSQARDTFFVDANQKTDENNFGKPLETENRTPEQVRDDLASSIIDSPDMLAQFLLGDEVSEQQMNDYADLLKKDSNEFQKARNRVLNFLKNSQVQVLEKTETFDTWWGEVVNGDVVMHRQIDDVKNDHYKNMVKIVAREVINGQERVIEREYDVECRNLIKTKVNHFNPGVPGGGFENPGQPGEPQTPETPPAPETPPELEKKDPSQDINRNPNLNQEAVKQNHSEVNTNIGNIEDQQHVVPETYVAPAPPPVDFSPVSNKNFEQIEQEFNQALNEIGAPEQGVNPAGNNAQNNGRVE